MEIMERKVGQPCRLNKDAIKTIAMLTMLCNHMGKVFFRPPLSDILINIGYFTAPVMCYFLVEGVQYSRSVEKYAARLLMFALVSQLPYQLALGHGPLLDWKNLNIFFNLFLCLALITGWERIREPNLRAIAVAAILACSCLCDWSILAPAMVMIFYRTEKEVKMAGIRPERPAGTGGQRDAQGYGAERTGGQRDAQGYGAERTGDQRDARGCGSAGTGGQRDARGYGPEGFRLRGRAWTAVVLLNGMITALKVLSGHQQGMHVSDMILPILASMAGPGAAAVCILFFYNGKRTSWHPVFFQWFFYLFYPLHLLMLAILRTR